MDIEIHIEELVLHGLPATDRYAISEAVSTELARLIAEQGAPALVTHSRDFQSLKSDNVTVTPGMKPAVLGTQIALSLYQSLDHVDIGK